LAAINGLGTGELRIEGTVTADGWRGCGHGNDSAGGGAGGSVLLVSDNVIVDDTAVVSAAGGLGGDTQGHPDCPSCAQSGGTCDDCGGGGGGGLISVLSGQPSQLGPLASFDVSGALGGTCTICQGEAGGGAGELQLDGVYIGEYCDGYDNDFDGLTDENLGQETCGSGACAVTVQSCNPATHEPNDCVPNSDPTCQDPLQDDTRGRILVIMDTSGSMLLDLDGNHTFGDGSFGHTGLDTDGDGTAGNDSRLFKAKEALGDVIAAYPEIDYALARFTQHTDSAVSCMLAHWVECRDLCCTYDDPTNNSGPLSCQITAGSAGTIDIRPQSAGEECINYVGWCGPPRRGADILVGFGADLYQHLMWLDHSESNFIDDETEGNYCRYDLNGDCELRGSGPTPLAGSLASARAYLAKRIALDPIAGCRTYNVILLTDGSETCRGDPAAAATEILDDLTINTYVIGFSVLPAEQSALDAIAAAGGTGSAFLAGDEDELATALASIVNQSIVYELCNGVDDDCDGLADEDFPLLGQPCDDGDLGPCLGTGTYQCRADQNGVECVITDPGASPTSESCNGIDDDCNGLTDDVPGGCEPPPPELCNGLDDDGDGATDEDLNDPALGQTCGSSAGICQPGVTICENGAVVCDQPFGPETETCNNLDDDCDGQTDEALTQPCYVHHAGYPEGCTYDAGTETWSCVGACATGIQICTAGSWSSCQGYVWEIDEQCNNVDDDCDGATDENLQRSCQDQNAHGTCTGTEECASGAWIDCSAATPAPETCNNVDDDCDGVTDQITRACYEAGTGCSEINPGVWSCEGECAAGTELCEHGAFGTCTGQQGPIDELCNGLDDDCDGNTDEDENNNPLTADCYTGPAATEDVGLCHGGTRTCTAAGTWGACNGQVTPATEICDGADNDCDGLTDEELGQTTCGLGVCRHTVQNCIGGVLTTCDPYLGASTETCDGTDNDCDGVVDGLSEACYAFGDGCVETNPGQFDCVGTCTPGVRHCPTPAQGGTGVWQDCLLDIGPQDELCDNLDNDCDGHTDEDADNNPLSEDCYPPGSGLTTGCLYDEPTDSWSCEGVCTTGQRICDTGTWLACSGQVTPAVETCNALDDDCDGATDEPEDIPGLGQSCGLALGRCSPGVLQCIDGQEVCEGGEGPYDPECNGLDDDCDGAIDEADEVADQEGQPCGSGEGECEPGETVCVGGEIVCQGGTQPSQEVCNGLDEDCDGVIDNDAVCPPDSYCVDGACRPICDPSDEFACPTGFECRAVEVEGQDVDLCMPVQGNCGGETCPEGWICVNDECVDPCDPNPCENWWETCREGVCVDETCSSPLVDCPPDQICQDHECVDDPCAQCTENEFCVQGACHSDPCAAVECGERQYCRRTCDGDFHCEAVCVDVCLCGQGEVCNADGVCTTDPCGGRCTAQEICDNGTCIADPCRDIQCAYDEACLDGQCVADPCAYVNCPHWAHCEVRAEGDADGAVCVPDEGVWEPGAPGEASDVLITGAGGCSCRAVGGSHPLTFGNVRNADSSKNRHLMVNVFGHFSKASFKWILLLLLLGLALWRRRIGRNVARVCSGKGGQR
jgi:hypothetical protein